MSVKFSNPPAATTTTEKPARAPAKVAHTNWRVTRPKFAQRLITKIARIAAKTKEELSFAITRRLRLPAYAISQRRWFGRWRFSQSNQTTSSAQNPNTPSINECWPKWIWVGAHATNAVTAAVKAPAPVNRQQNTAESTRVRILN